MPKNKISEFSSTPANNTDIGSIDIAEGCAPSGINNAIRELMAQLKDQQAGTDGDSFTVGGALSVTGTSTLTGVVTATAGVTGNLTGNVTGNVTGNLTGNVTGNTSGTSANVTGTVVVANGGTGLTTLTANNVILGNGTSTPSFVAPSTTGNVLTSNGTTWQSTELNRLTSGIAQASTSGTAINFTGIPSWVKRITVMFSDVSTNGSSNVQVQLGAGSIQTTGYMSASFSYNSTTAASSTTGLIIDQGSSSGGSSASRMGSIIISLLGSNTWVSQGCLTTSNVTPSAGRVNLSGTLDRLRITTINGTDTFDAGSINIMYE